MTGKALAALPHDLCGDRKDIGYTLRNKPILGHAAGAFREATMFERDAMRGIGALKLAREDDYLSNDYLKSRVRPVREFDI